MSSGPTSSDVYQVLHFASDLTDGTQFSIATFDANGWLSGYDIGYDQGQFYGSRSDFGANGKGAVPEPATWLTLLAGVGVLGIVRYRAA